MIALLHFHNFDPQPETRMIDLWGRSDTENLKADIFIRDQIGQYVERHELISNDLWLEDNVIATKYQYYSYSLNVDQRNILFDAIGRFRLKMERVRLF